MRRSWKSGRQTILTAALCALAAAGCAGVPNSGIDPSGERILTAPAPPAAAADRSNERYFDQPLGQVSWDDVAVQLQPRETVAAVGSEVVLIAGVCGPDGYLRTNRRLEWSIDPGSTGQFVAVGQSGLIDLMLGDFNRPRKITNTFAIGSTSRSNTRLNRGTCRPEENIYVLRGQGWISLTSPVEGDSHVTVVAPEVYRWDARLQSAVVHWVDAQWRFPTPAINPAGGRQVLGTTVTRQTNQTPCERWLVRYEIQGGPAAGFMPDGAPAVEVPTDSTGQANVEIFQKEPKHGTNKICIQVIRPADLPGANGQRLVVGSGTTTTTWTAADLAVKVSGPTAASPGANLSYRIDVSNPGDLAAKEVVATCTVPDGLTLVVSNPPAESTGRQLLWRLGELGARQQRTIEVQFRSEKQGSVALCCEATATGGLKVGDCTTTALSAASLDVRLSGPPQATVGSQVTFEITVRNIGQAPATGLVIKDRLDPGLEHPAVNQQNAIERLLGNLAAGASQQISVTFRVTKPGRLCHTVEVTGKDVAAAGAQGCVVVADAAATAPLGGEAAAPQPGAPPLAVKKTGPRLPLAVGEKARFTVDLSNTGSVALQGVKIVDRCDPALVPVLATDGYRIEQGALTWTIDNLPAGKTIRVEIHCTCQTAAARTCNRVIATTSDGAKVEAEACLEIRAAGAAPPDITSAAPPAAETLTMSVVGLTQPATAGKELTYVIQVTNNGPESYRQMSLTATAPEGMMPVALRTVGPGPTKFAIEGRSVRFDPVFEVLPNESLEYRVRVLAKQPGQFRFRAELSAPALPQPLVRETDTEVTERRE